MLTQAQLKEVIYYDQETGLFTYKARLAHRVRVGEVAGYISNQSGYRIITVFSKRYMAHRLAFLYMTGKFPDDLVDHINGDRRDNSWKNLRPASRAENAENMRGAMKDSKTKLLGASPHPDGRYQAKICVRNKQHHLGLFDTPEEAHAAYLNAKREIHKFCTI